MCDITYPLEIVPQEDYIIDGFSLDDVLAECSDISISRRVDGNVEDFIDYDEKRPRLDTDCFGEHYERLSVNLMNSLFRNEHIKFSAKGDAGKPWNGKRINVEDYRAHISLSHDSSAIFYKVKNLHKRKLCINQSLKKEQYDAMKTALTEWSMQAFSNKSEKQDVVFKGHIAVDHVPVNMNYWHCQLEIYPKGIDDPLKNKKSWREEIFIHVLSNILSYDFEITSDSNYEINKKLYIKQL